MLATFCIIFTMVLLACAVYDRKRNFFDKKNLKSAYYRCRRLSSNNSDCAVLFLDLDHMKSVNDRFSHIIGDKIIARFVNIIKENVRSEDSVVRFGGDEYVVFMPRVDQNTVDSRIKQIQNACLEDKTFQELIGSGMSVSVGAVLVNDLKNHGTEELLEKSSILMKRAKRKVSHRVLRPVENLGHFEPEESEIPRRADEAGDDMRAYFNFIVEYLSRKSGYDPSLLSLCCRELWRENGEGIVAHQNFSEIKRQVLKKYQEVNTMNDVAKAYEGEVA